MPQCGGRAQGNSPSWDHRWSRNVIGPHHHNPRGLFSRMSALHGGEDLRKFESATNSSGTFLLEALHGPYFDALTTESFHNLEIGVVIGDYQINFLTGTYS